MNKIDPASENPGSDVMRQRAFRMLDSVGVRILICVNLPFFCFAKIDEFLLREILVELLEPSIDPGDLVHAISPSP